MWEIPRRDAGSSHASRGAPRSTLATGASAIFCTLNVSPFGKNPFLRRARAETAITADVPVGAAFN